MQLGEPDCRYSHNPGQGKGERHNVTRLAVHAAVTRRELCDWMSALVERLGLVVLCSHIPCGPCFIETRRTRSVAMTRMEVEVEVAVGEVCPRDSQRRPARGNHNGQNIHPLLAPEPPTTRPHFPVQVLGFPLHSGTIVCTNHGLRSPINPARSTWQICGCFRALVISDQGRLPEGRCIIL